MGRRRTAPDDAEPDGELFLVGLLASIVLPWLLLKWFRLLFGSSQPTEAKAWQKLGFSVGSPIVSKATALQSPWPRWATKANGVLCLLFALLAVLAHRQHEMRKTVNNVFDPHSVLGVEEYATNVEIKAAYRRLALENHPDKNPSPEAHARFAEITKAHAVLTDSAAAENFRRFGNPDGYQGMQFGIGLPTWMMGELGMAIGLVLALGIPGLAIFYAQGDPKVEQGRLIGKAAADIYLEAAEPQVEMATAPGAPQNHKVRADAIAPSKLLGLCASAFAPFSFLGGLNDEQRKALLELKPAKTGAETAGASDNSGEAKGKQKANGGAKKRKGDKKTAAEGGSDDGREARDVTENEAKGESPSQITVTTAREWLLAAHLARRPVPACLQAEQARLLLHAPAVCEAFFAVAFGLGKVLPVPWRPILHLAQRLCQALPGDAAATTTSSSPNSTAATSDTVSLLQVPYFDVRVAQRAQAGGAAGVRSVSDLVALDSASRAAFLTQLGLSPGERAEAAAFCARVFPRASLTARYGVKGEDASRGVAAGDLVTIYPTLRLHHRLAPASCSSDTAGPPPDSCHAPLYPYPKPEGWCLIVTDAASGAICGLAAPPRSFADWKPALTATTQTAAAHGSKDARRKDMKLKNSENKGPGTGEEAGIEWTGEVKLRVPITWTGRTVSLEMHAICSAYVGADVSTTVAVQVLSAQEARAKLQEEEEEDEETDDDDDDDDNDDEDDGDDDDDDETPDEIEFNDE